MIKIINLYWQWAKTIEWLNEDRKQVLGITAGIVILWWITK